MTIAIRPVIPGDIPAMAALRALEWETEAYWLHRITGYIFGDQSPQQALPGRAAFAAVDGDALAGFVAGHRTRRLDCDAELQWINVAKSSRGTGLARRLVAAMAAWFIEQGARRVCVNVEPDNAIARRLYGHCGALPFKTHWMIWEDCRAMLGQEG